MMGINEHYAAITLNSNNLNYPIKRQWVTDWIRKQETSFLLPPGNTTHPWMPTVLRGKGRKVFYANRTKKQADKSSLMSDHILQNKDSK